MFWIVLGAIVVIIAVIILSLCKMAGVTDDQLQREYEKMQSRSDNDGDN